MAFESATRLRPQIQPYRDSQPQSGTLQAMRRTGCWNLPRESAFLPGRTWQGSHRKAEKAIPCQVRLAGLLANSAGRPDVRCYFDSTSTPARLPIVPGITGGVPILTERPSRYAAQSAHKASACSRTSFVASACRSGGYPCCRRIRRTNTRILARALSRTVQSIVTPTRTF